MKRVHVIGSSVVFAISAIAAASAFADTTEELPAELAEYELTGETKSCVGLRRIRTIDPIDDRHFLIKVSSKELYLNRANGRCAGADRSNTRLQYKTSLNRLCQHEIVTVVDNSSGFSRGSCGLGSFERLAPIPEEESSEETEAQ